MVGWVFGIGIIILIAAAVISFLSDEERAVGCFGGIVAALALSYFVIPNVQSGWAWITGHSTTQHTKLVAYNVISKPHPIDGNDIPSARTVEWQVTLDNEGEYETGEDNTVKSVKLRLDLQYCAGRQATCRAVGVPHYVTAFPESCHTDSNATFCGLLPGRRASTKGTPFDITGVPTGHFVTGRISIDHACTEAEKSHCKS